MEAEYLGQFGEDNHHLYVVHLQVRKNDFETLFEEPLIAPIKNHTTAKPTGQMLILERMTWSRKSRTHCNKEKIDLTITTRDYKTIPRKEVEIIDNRTNSHFLFQQS